MPFIYSTHHYFAFSFMWKVLSILSKLMFRNYCNSPYSSEVDEKAWRLKCVVSRIRRRSPFLALFGLISFNFHPWLLWRYPRHLMTCAADMTLGRKLHIFGLEIQHPSSSQSVWTTFNKMKLNEAISKAMFLRWKNSLRT